LSIAEKHFVPPPISILEIAFISIFRLTKQHGEISRKSHRNESTLSIRFTTAILRLKETELKIYNDDEKQGAF
jgi:hypothetical protein